MSISRIDDATMKVLLQMVLGKDIGMMPSDVMREIAIKLIKKELKNQEQLYKELISLLSDYDFDVYA